MHPLILKRHTIVKVTSYILPAYYRRNLINENSELIALRVKLNL